MIKITFFKSKILLILILVLTLFLLTLNYFSVSNNSQNTQKIISQNSSSVLPTILLNQNSSQSNSKSFNSQNSSLSTSTQNANFASLQVSSSSNFSISNSQKSPYLVGEVSDSGIAPLQADNEHDVVVLEEGDLAVKYEKKYKIGELYGNADNFIQISCGKKYIKPPFNEITKIVGWEGTSAKITNAKDYSPFTIKMAEKVDKIYSSFTGNGPFTGQYLNIGFEFQDKFFIISSNKNNDLFDANILQLQFNSLAPSTPSVKL